MDFESWFTLLLSDLQSAYLVRGGIRTSAGLRNRRRFAFHDPWRFCDFEAPRSPFGLASNSKIRCLLIGWDSPADLSAPFKRERAAQSLSGKPVLQPDRAHRSHRTNQHPCLKPTNPARRTVLCAPRTPLSSSSGGTPISGISSDHS